jgi:hypothetical protein
MEANVLRRLGEGAGIDTMARELGLAAPLVQESRPGICQVRSEEGAWESGPAAPIIDLLIHLISFIGFPREAPSALFNIGMRARVSSRVQPLRTT